MNKAQYTISRTRQRASLIAGCKLAGAPEEMKDKSAPRRTQQALINENLYDAKAGGQ